MHTNETVDCNEVTDFLVFCKDDSDNLPIAHYGILMTLIRDSNIRVQIFWSSISDIMVFTRTKINGEWRVWHNIQLA